MTAAMMRLQSGSLVDVLALRPGDVNLGDIAHSLSQLCRFGGQCDTFYSVAQHSVHIAETMFQMTGDAIRAKRALLHDAAEAYLGDLPRPIKQQPELDYFTALEDRVLDTVYQCFGIPNVPDKILTALDNGIVLIEARQLFQPPFEPRGVSQHLEILGWNLRIDPWPPLTARRKFLALWHELPSDG